MLIHPALEPNDKCSSKEVSFSAQWKEKPIADTEKELARMQAVFAKASEDREKDPSALVGWMGMRINILKQVGAVTTARTHD